MEVAAIAGHRGLVLAADVAGDGEFGVVLLHGGGQTRHSWRGTARRLARTGYHVVSADLRGHGDSEWATDRAYDLDDYARDLSELVSWTRRDRVAVVGASLGGLAALTLLGADPPAAIAALVLVDVVPYVSPRGTARISAFLNAHLDGFASLEEAAEAIAGYLPDRAPRKAGSGLEKNLRRRSDGRYYWHWDPAMMVGHRTEPAHLSRERLKAAARRVSVPTMLIRGAKSDIVTDEGVNELRSLIPHCEYRDVSNAGHMLVGDKNDAFDAAVRSFLDRVRDQGPRGVDIWTTTV